MQQDLDKDDYIPDGYRKASAKEVHALTLLEGEERRRRDAVRGKKLAEMGFEMEHAGEVLF